MSAEERRRVTRGVVRQKVFNEVEVIWRHRFWACMDASSGRWPVDGVVTSAKNGDGSDEEGGDDTNCEKNNNTDDDEDDKDDEEDDDEIDEDDDEDEIDFFPTRLEPRSPHCPTADVRQAAEEVLELLFHLSITISTETLIDGQPSSTLLVYFSGILGLASNGKGFCLARNYTTVLSALIYIQRLLLLEQTLPLGDYPYIRISKRPTLSQLDRLQEVRRASYTVGCDGPFDELFRLRCYGKAWAKDEPPSVFLRWSDDGQVVSYNDEMQFSMQQFRVLADYFLTAAETLYTRLLFGIEPRIDLSQLQDQMSNTQVGFSFVSYRANQLEQVLTEGSICGRTGLVHNGVWNWDAVINYLKTVDELERAIVGGLYTACGQGPRAEELLTLLLANGLYGTRSFYIWNGFVVYILRHHKAKRSTNREFYVVRFLPARLGLVVAGYLVYIRLFADMLTRQMFGAEGRKQMAKCERRFLFERYRKGPAGAFLAKILRHASERAWGTCVNVQQYRQLSTGIAEKHVREVVRPFNIYDDHSAEADLNTAIAWQSGHRPLQRGISYGLDAAYPTRLQPSLLRAYEWASTRWHVFLRQASRAEAQEVSKDVQHEPEQRAQCQKRPSSPGTTEGHGRDKRQRVAATTPQAAAAATESATWPEPRERNVSMQTNWLNRPPPLFPSGQFVEPACQAKTWDEVLCINQEHRALICKLCGSAVVPGKGLQTHLQNTHRLKADLLREAVFHCSQFIFVNPLTDPLPADGSRAIPELPTHRGYSCTQCQFRSRARDTFTRHWRLSKHQADGAQYEEVMLQSWCKGRHTRYWIVQNN